MRFNEDKNFAEALAYVKGTYGEHYANNDKHQLMDDIIESGEDLAFNRWNAIKYLKRYGKKSGYNRKDILKAIHYSILLLYHNDQLVQDKQVYSDEKPKRSGPPTTPIPTKSTPIFPNNPFNEILVGSPTDKVTIT